MNVIAQPAFAGRDANPYTWLLYKPMTAHVTDFSYRRALSARYDILHIHWPEWELNAFRSVAKVGARLRLKLLLIDALRARGTKIVWTVHNLRAHEGLHPRMEQWFWFAFTKRLDGYIALSDSGRLAARERFPNLERAPGFVIPHGHYRGEYQVDANVDARKALGIPSRTKVIVYFGQIRDYKNVPVLIRAFRRMQGEDTVLCIAGRPNPESLGEELRKEAAGDARIQLHLRNIPKDQVQLFFWAADLVVLPYRDILNSGTALLALSFNRPILVPCCGAMGELCSSVGPEWVRTYQGELDTDELECALLWATESPRPQEATLSGLEWPEIAGQTLRAYADIISTGRS
jgi:glycosyltransferase involved in cell wall biosynthesis